jgi:hypothetical protein
MNMRRTNLYGIHAEQVLNFCKQQGIQIDAQLERQLERGCETMLKPRSEMTAEEKKKIDSWLDDQMGDE